MSLCATGTLLRRERVCVPLDWNVNTLKLPRATSTTLALQYVLLDQLKHAGCFVESSSSCQRSPFGLPPKSTFTGVKVTQWVQNAAQETNTAQLLKKFSGFYRAQKLHYHAGSHPMPDQSILQTHALFFMYSEFDTDVTLTQLLS
jgi:hypothetical protein